MGSRDGMFGMSCMVRECVFGAGVARGCHIALLDLLRAPEVPDTGHTHFFPNGVSATPLCSYNYCWEKPPLCIKRFEEERDTV
jgi:hypothetical protein